MNKIDLSRKSFFGLLALLIMIFIPLLILDLYFKEFFNIYVFFGIVLIIAFINGFIFEDSIKQSILELVVVMEFIVIVYLFISFAFDPWGNATHIPITLGSLYLLFFVTSILSGLIFILVVLFGFFIYQFAVYGISFKQRNQKKLSEEDLSTF